VAKSISKRVLFFIIYSVLCNFKQEIVYSTAAREYAFYMNGHIPGLYPAGDSLIVNDFTINRYRSASRHINTSICYYYLVLRKSERVIFLIYSLCSPYVCESRVEKSGKR